MNSQPPVVSPAVAEALLLAVVPTFVLLQKQIFDRAGDLPVHADINALISRLKIEDYPILYRDERLIWANFLFGELGRDNFQAFCAEAETLSLEARSDLLLSMVSDAEEEVAGVVDSLFIKDKRVLVRLRRDFRRLSPSQQKGAVESARRCAGALLAGFYQSMSLMTHGEKLTSLVAKAIDGDIEAAAKAIQVDKRIYLEIPEIKRMWFRIMSSPGTPEARRFLAAHGVAPFGGGLEYRAAYLIVALLDQLQLLDAISNVRLLELMDRAGIVSVTNEPFPEQKAFDRVVREYKRKRHIGSEMSTQSISESTGSM